MADERRRFLSECSLSNPKKLSFPFHLDVIKKTTKKIPREESVLEVPSFKTKSGARETVSKLENVYEVSVVRLLIACSSKECRGQQSSSNGELRFCIKQEHSQ